MNNSTNFICIESNHRAHTYDQQIKLKADSPQSQFAKESINQHFFYMHESSKGSKITYLFFFIFRSGKSLVLPTMQRA